MPNRFYWSEYTEEPHASRRKLILEAHPEIKQLFGIDPSFRFVVVAIVLTQLTMSVLLKNEDWTLILLEMYFVGCVMNHALTLAIHELSHNLGFGIHRPVLNRTLGIFANLPIIIPYSVSFKKYHLIHHRYMGEDGLDTDIPTELEGKLFHSRFGKFVWLMLQPVFYAFRPLIVYKKAPTDLEIINVVIQMSFNVFVYKYLGVKSLVYLFGCTLISLGAHPTAGHFISEHYIVKPGQETYSYYGPLNLVTFNVGMHVEHHDFPFISGQNLPLVRKIAPEFYQDFVHHTSWIKVLYDFVTSPDIGPYARIKRKPRVPQEFYDSGLVWPYIEAVLCYSGLSQARSKLVNLASCSSESSMVSF